MPCLLVLGMTSVAVLGADPENLPASKRMGNQITGTVWALGKRPPATRLPVFKNADYCGTSLPDRSLILDPEGRLKAAAVILEPVDQQFPVTPVQVVLDNYRCAFRPRVQIVPAGSSVILKNSDPILHAVHARLSGETLFNVGLPTWRQVTQVLKKPGVVAIDCDVLHTWMRASVLVTLSPYFAITNERGYFHIGNVPAGVYDLVVWHEVLGRKTRRIKISTADALFFSTIYSL